MPDVALSIRPTETGWAVCLSNGQELTRYRGLCSKQLAVRYLYRYAASLSTNQRPRASGITGLLGPAFTSSRRVRRS